MVYVIVEDADAAYERAKAAGAEVTEPVDQDHGSRDITVRDPDGNRWSLGTYPARPPGSGLALRGCSSLDRHLRSVTAMPRGRRFASIQRLRAHRAQHGADPHEGR